MKILCLLLAASLGQNHPSTDLPRSAVMSTGDPNAARPSGFVVPWSSLAFQQPPGGFGGGPGFGMSMGGAGMGPAGGMGMSSGMAMGGMGMSGMGMANMSGMGMNGGWNQVAQQTQASTGSTKSTRPAEILSDAAQDELELTVKQRRRLRELQKKVDAALEDMLTEDQKDYLQVMATRGTSRTAGQP